MTRRSLFATLLAPFLPKLSNWRPGRVKMRPLAKLLGRHYDWLVVKDVIVPPAVNGTLKFIRVADHPGIVVWSGPYHKGDLYKELVDRGA